MHSPSPPRWWSQFIGRAIRLTIGRYRSSRTLVFLGAVSWTNKTYPHDIYHPYPIKTSRQLHFSDQLSPLSFREFEFRPAALSGEVEQELAARTLVDTRSGSLPNFRSLHHSAMIGTNKSKPSNTQRRRRRREKGKGSSIVKGTNSATIQLFVFRRSWARKMLRGARRINDHRSLLRRRCVSFINYDFNKGSESSARLMAGILLLSIIIGTRDEREDRKFSRPFPSIFFSIVIGKTTARINVPNARKFTAVFRVS